MNNNRQQNYQQNYNYNQAPSQQYQQQTQQQYAQSAPMQNYMRPMPQMGNQPVPSMYPPQPQQSMYPPQQSQNQQQQMNPLQGINPSLLLNQISAVPQPPPMTGYYNQMMSYGQQQQPYAPQSYGQPAAYPSYPQHQPYAQYPPYQAAPQSVVPPYGAPKQRVAGGIGRDRDQYKSSDRAGELPGRILFVRNIPYDADKAEVQALFTPFGDIKEFFSMDSRKGMAFVTYFDSRAAKNAKDTLVKNKTMLNGRTLDIHWSLPKEEDMQSRACDRDKNQGTLLLTFKNGKSSLDDNLLKETFTKYPSFKVLRPYKTFANQRFIEYFDSRDCQKAFDEHHEKPFQDGFLDLRFAWDNPHSKRSEAAGVTVEKKALGSGGPIREPKRRRDDGPYIPNDRRTVKGRFDSRSQVSDSVPTQGFGPSAVSQQYDASQQAQKLLESLQSSSNQLPISDTASVLSQTSTPNINAILGLSGNQHLPPTGNVSSGAPGVQISPLLQVMLGQQSKDGSPQKQKPVSEPVITDPRLKKSPQVPDLQTKSSSSNFIIDKSGASSPKSVTSSVKDDKPVVEKKVATIGDVNALVNQLLAQAKK